MERRNDLYGGKSPLELPAYTPADAAHYLRLPVSTVRAWLFGRGYPTRGGTGRFRPLIQIADRTSRLLSFHNMVELHVLRGLRTKHGVKLPEVRKALAYLERKFGTKRPLLDEPLLTDNTYVLVERYGSLINASKEGQEEMVVAVRQHLARVKRDDHGVPAIGHDDEFPDDERDEDWLPAVAERGWVVLTRDGRIRYNPLEREALERSGARAFILSGRGATGRENGEVFCSHIHRISKLCRDHLAPIVATVTRSGIKVKLSGGRRAAKRR